MESEYKVLKGAKLIDGTGAEPMDDVVLVIKDDKIESVGTSEAVDYPTEAPVIDLMRKTVMPGLIDAHLHLFGIKNLLFEDFIKCDPLLRGIRGVVEVWKLIDAGFTTVRECCSINGIHLRNAVNEGTLIGPRILASGRSISQTAGHGDMHYLPVEMAGSNYNTVSMLADGVSEVRKAARTQLRLGADFLKIFTTGGVLSEGDDSKSSQFSLEEIKAFVDEAKNWGCRTASHSQGTPGIKNALRCGIDSIEHGFYLDDECIELMIKQNTYLVPTLVVVDDIARMGHLAGLPESSIKKAKRAREAHLKSFKKAYQAGVRCGLGTDRMGGMASPHGTNAVELALYVDKIGLTPMEAIVCATKNNAEVLGLEEEIGTVESGKQADLIVVDGNPLDDIKILQDKSKITTVYKAGRDVPRYDAIGFGW